MDSSDEGRSVTKSTACMGPSSACLNDALLDNLAQQEPRLVRTAARMIRELDVDEGALDAEGAVHMAFLSVRQTVLRDSRRTRTESDEFLKLFNCALLEIIDECKRGLQTVKRGGPGRTPTSSGPPAATGSGFGRPPRQSWRRVKADLDARVSHDPPVGDAVDAAIDFETLLCRLPDDSHRAVLRLRTHGFTIQEIAASLGIHRETVACKITRIRRIYREQFENNSDTKTRFGK